VAKDTLGESKDVSISEEYVIYCLIYHRCLGGLIKKNYFDTCTYLLQEYFSLEPKKLSSNQLLHLLLIEAESSVRNAIDQVRKQ